MPGVYRSPRYVEAISVEDDHRAKSIGLEPTTYGVSRFGCYHSVPSPWPNDGRWALDSLCVPKCGNGIVVDVQTEEPRPHMPTSYTTHCDDLLVER